MPDPTTPPSLPGWQELWLEVGAADAEPWSEALLEAGALSVQAEDADADSPDEQAQYGEPGMQTPGLVPGWQRTALSALLDAHSDAMALLAGAAARLGQAPPQVREIRSVLDQDWVRLTQAQFTPITLGHRLRITPSWLPDTADGRVTVTLDPGLAFGTGSHPTTQLCLEWLDRHLAPAHTVIDYGCGSGILAIAAARLGATQVTAIDIDPQALSATLVNAERNQVRVQVQSPNDPKPAPAQVVVANILSSPLKLLAPVLMDLVAPGGTLVLSGILERQVEEVSAAYAPRMALSPVQAREGWACLVGSRNA